MRRAAASSAAAHPPARVLQVLTLLVAYLTLCIPRAARWIDRRFGGILLPGWATPIALGSVALLLVQSFDHQYVRGSLGWSIFIVSCLAALFVALLYALLRPDDRLKPARRRPFTALLIGVLVLDTLLHAVLLVPHLMELNRYSTDAGAATDCATQMALHGQDPYTNLHMLMCLDEHGLHFSQTTPKSEGAFKHVVTFAAPDPATINWIMYTVYNQDLRLERADKTYPYHYSAPEFEERFNYPGGAILFGMIGWAIGARDLVAVYLLAALGASVWIYRRAHPRIRPATGLLLLADLPLLIDSTNGVTDVLYALLLVVYWNVRERVILGGLVLGVAAATRQDVWFFIPFLLYLAWRTGGWEDVRRRSIVAGLVFLACNAPFLVQSPGDWVAGVLGPVREPLFAEGIGLIAISIAIFKQHPGIPAYYTLLEVMAYLLLFRTFMRRWTTSPGLAMLLPLLPLALGWRSLHTYFIVLPLLAVAVLAAPDRWNAARRTADTSDGEAALGLPHGRGQRADPATAVAPYAAMRPQSQVSHARMPAPGHAPTRAPAVAPYAAVRPQSQVPHDGST